MSSEDKPDQVAPIAASPPSGADAQAPPIQPEQPADQPLSDEDLDKVSGGIYRKKAAVYW